MRITKDTLHGAALTSAVYALAQTTAKLAAGSVADLTDNSGGAAANGELVAIPASSTAPEVGNNVPTKAAMEAALGAVRDGITEIAAQIVAVAARVPAFTPVNSIGGAAADGTIAVIPVVPAADNVGPRVSRTGFATLVTAYMTAFRELVYDTNALAVACGGTKLTGSVGGTSRGAASFDHTHAALSTDTGAAPADSSGSVTVAESTATLTAMRDNLAELAAKLNTLTTDTAPAAKVFAA